MLTRDEWHRACRMARTGGALTVTLPNLKAAYQTVTGRYPFEAIQGLALE